MRDERMRTSERNKGIKQIIYFHISLFHDFLEDDLSFWFLSFRSLLLVFQYLRPKKFGVEEIIDADSLVKACGWGPSLRTIATFLQECLTKKMFFHKYVLFVSLFLSLESLYIVGMG